MITLDFSSNDNQPVSVSSKCKWMDLSLVLDFARRLKQETVTCFVKKKGQIKTLETWTWENESVFWNLKVG